MKQGVIGETSFLEFILTYLKVTSLLRVYKKNREFFQILYIPQ